MNNFKINIFKTRLEYVTGTGLVYVSVSQTNLDGLVTNVKVNGIDIITLPLQGNFPVSSGNSLVGSYGSAIPNLSTVEVYISVATDAPINLSLNTGYTDCIIGTGTAPTIFTGVDLSTNANIVIVLQQEGTSYI